MEDAGGRAADSAANGTSNRTLLVIGYGSLLSGYGLLAERRGGGSRLIARDAFAVRLRNARHKRDSAPLESDCPCMTCRQFSRAYLHHLFLADEMLGPTLLSLHNVAFYCRLMEELRQAIAAGRFAELRAVCLARWGGSL